MDLPPPFFSLLSFPPQITPPPLTFLILQSNLALLPMRFLQCSGAHRTSNEPLSDTAIDPPPSVQHVTLPSHCSAPFSPSRCLYCARLLFCILRLCFDPHTPSPSPGTDPLSPVFSAPPPLLSSLPPHPLLSLLT